jgi:hypothetical protein
MPILKGAKDSIRLKVTAIFEQTADDAEVRVPFRAVYKSLKQSEAKAVIDSVQAGELSDDDLMKRFLLGWDLTDADNEPVPFNEREIGEVMEIRPYRKALVDGFLQSLLGKKGITAKN